MASQGAGLLAGGLLLLRFRPQRLLLVGMGAFSVAALPIFFLASLRSTPVIAAGYFIAGVSLEIFSILWAMAMQQNVPQEKLSRVSAYDALGSIVFVPLGLSLAGPVADAVGLTNALWGAGLLGTAATRLGAGGARRARAPEAGRRGARGRAGVGGDLITALPQRSPASSRRSPTSTRRRQRGPRRTRRTYRRRGRALRFPPSPARRCSTGLWGSGSSGRRRRSSRRSSLLRELGIEWCAAVAPQAEPARARLVARNARPGARATLGPSSGAGSTTPRRSRRARVERVGKREGERVRRDLHSRLRRTRLMRRLARPAPGREGWDCFIAYDGEASRRRPARSTSARASAGSASPRPCRSTAGAARRARCSRPGSVRPPRRAARWP